MDSFVTQQQQRLNKIKSKEALNKIRSIAKVFYYQPYILNY